MEFLKLIENLKEEKANLATAFKGDGASVRTQEEDLAKLADAAEFMESIRTGRKPSYLFQEAMTTSDFPLLFGQIIDRQLLGNYKAFSASYNLYSKVDSVRDFRTVDRYYIDGAEGVLDAVPESAEYPNRVVAEGKYQFSVKKYGAVMPITWETRINDDLGALNDWPARLAKAAGRTVERLITMQYCDANGPSAANSFFVNGSGNDNLLTNNPVLTLENLQTAYQHLTSQVDTDGEPIWVEAAVLVVPPALAIQARNILGTIEHRITTAGNDVDIVKGNGLPNITLVVNPYIPIVTTTGTVGNTEWFLFASPGDSRPALVTGFLRGHESPELFMRAPNALRIGGGSVNPLDGDFATDAIDYKVRFVVGAAQMDGKTVVASKGTGA